MPHKKLFRQSPIPTVDRLLDIAYQTARHVAQHMRQWPQSNRAEVERDIRQRLDTGNAWHYREPQQLELGL